MAKYTTAVRTICEVNAGLTEGKGYDSIDEVIKSAIPKIFSFDFPIFDEDYRIPLCVKILKHYYMREICEETVGLWKLRLDTKLNEIMPYYNELYKSTLLEFNPLIDVKLDKTYTLQHTGETVTEKSGNDNLTINDEVVSNETHKIDNNSTNTSTKQETTQETNETAQNTTENEGTIKSRDFEHNNTSYDLFSETPQGGLTGLDDGEYLTNARKLTDNTTDTTTDNGSRDKTVDFTGNLSGNVNFNANNTDTKNYEENFEKEKKDTKTNTENRITTDNEKVDLNNTDEYIENITGKTAGKSYASMLLEFRKTLINIDMMIIDELSDLFFMLW